MMTITNLQPALAQSCTQLNGLSLPELLARVDDPRQSILLRLYHAHATLFHHNPGSSHNHQAWPGGLADHYADLYRLSGFLYATYAQLFTSRGETIPFSLGSAHVVIFTHDAEKLFKYAPAGHPLAARYRALHPRLAWDAIRDRHILPDWRNEYGLELTADESNAHHYIHGEGRDYRGDLRVMNELAAFCHQLDNAGARIFHSSGQGLSRPATPS